MRRLGLALAALAALFWAVPAGATDYQMFLGEQLTCGFAAHCPGVTGVPKGTTFHEFFPRTVTIAAGDSITFSSATDHSVAYGFPQPAFYSADPAHGTYRDVFDANGSPFYFLGLPKKIYNVKAYGPFGSTTVTAGSVESSGALFPAAPKAKPATFTFTFPTAGTYKLLCTVHPGMTAKVVVAPPGSTPPLTPTQVVAAALQGESAAWEKAKAMAAAADPPPLTVYMGLGQEETVLGYFPRKLTIKAGTTVTFVNKASGVPHNVTFGPKAYIQALQKGTDRFPGPGLPMAPTAPNQVAPFRLYGSEPRGRYVYDGSNHGNGFLATPLTFGPGVGIGSPHSSQVRFPKPGKYRFFCWVHGPDMGGEIDVTK